MSDPGDPRYGKDGRTYAEAIDAGTHLGEQEQEIASSYDKHLLTLASGALAVSVGFVEKIAPNPVWTILLFGAWAAFGLCILTNLLAILFAQESIAKHGVLSRCRYEQEAGTFTDENPWERRVGYANWTSLVLFVVGVLLMIVFSGVNQKGSLMSSSKRAGRARSQSNPPARVRSRETQDQQLLRKAGAAQELPNLPSRQKNSAVQLGHCSRRRAVRRHARRIMSMCCSCHVKHGAAEWQDVGRPNGMIVAPETRWRLNA